MSKTVLICDDEAYILESVKYVVQKEGFHVITGDDGEKALALAREHKPALAVLDIGMPGLDGLEVLAEIRADEALRGMLVLLLTAKAQESDVRRGYDSGADAYVKKPFSPAELSTRVRGLLDPAAS